MKPRTVPAGAPTPAAEPAPEHRRLPMPQEGGSFIRQPDGSLERETPAKHNGGGRTRPQPADDRKE